MVQVVPPEGWQKEEKSAGEAAQPTAATAGVVAATGEATAEPPATSSTPGSAQADEAVGQATQVAAAEGMSDTAAAIPAGAEAESLGPGSPSASPTELLWRKWVLWAAAPAAGLVVVIGAWSIFFSSSRSEPTPERVVEQPVEPAPGDQPATPKQHPQPAPDRIDHRWLPDETTLVFSFRPSQLVGRMDSGKLIDQVDGLWRQTAGAVLESLGLKLQTTRRLTWASTDLGAWPEHSVAVIELEPEQNAELLGAPGEAVDLHVAGVSCRRLANADWPHPFAIIDRQTIVTGRVDLLRGLADRSELKLESAPLKRLLKAIDPGADLTLLVDLAAARHASWNLPTNVLDVWPAGKQAWHVLWGMPEGLGCTLHFADRLQSELVLVCEGQTAAEQVHAAVAELVPAAGQSLAAQLQSLPEKLQAGQLTVAAAHQYELLLSEGLAASRAARWEVADDLVWIRVDSGEGPSKLSAAAIATRPAIRTDWLAAAREADAANHRRLLAGLGGYQKAEGWFPEAAADSALLPPETRLSWIAAMLPYYGHADWHRRLEFGYSWNGPENRPLTRQPLPEVVNPALGPSRTEAGFPVTHYVGVAGVGSDAGRLKADHSRAGVFGYGRRTRLEDLSDGAANTIALLGVTGRLGPWAAGGDPTVRPLTKPPYVHGPDGFGSGQPDGMLAGMADGSVRFISKDVDPRVLEQLAAIHGQQQAPVLAHNPKPDLPRLELDLPDATPKAPGEKPADPEPQVKPEGPPEASPDEPDNRPAPPPVDVDARLADTVPQIELREMPLDEAVDLLATMSALPVSFDPEAMLQFGVTLRDPVSVRLSEATVGRILQSVVSGRGLAVVVDNGQVLVTSPPENRETLIERRYTVSDLAASDAADVAGLAALVQKFVAPDSWTKRGGQGTIEASDGLLVVRQTGVVHYQILLFCEKLRNARGKPLRSRLDPDRFVLATRYDRAKQLLGQPVSVNFHEPTPLVQIVAYLEELTGADILIDRLALSRAGLTDQVRATLKVQKQPLSTALEELLEPPDLAFRIIDAKTLQVTTRKALSARLELEFYPASDLLAGARPAQAVIEQIKGRVAGSTWSDAGGPGVLHLDGPSGCLIVLQSQPVQAELGRLLAGLRN